MIAAQLETEEGQATESTGAAVLPSKTLTAIFGTEPRFHVRSSVSDPGWLRLNQGILDALTGFQLSIAGNMPVLCSRDVVDSRALMLLADAGLEIASSFDVYDDAADYLQYVRKCKEKLAVQYVHPEGEIPAEKYWISRDLLAYINNKANLPELVTAACVPARRSLRVGKRLRMPTRFPVVAKVGTEAASGGGFGVRICKSHAEFQEALKTLEEPASLLLEEFLPIRRNLCIQYAIAADGGVEYLGAAEQVMNRDGNYQGNWLGSGCTPSSAAKFAGQLIAERAAGLGYRGIAGFDTAELVDGRVFVFDLNFRINGSSVPLLLYAGVARRYGAPVMRYRTWSYTGSYSRMLEHVRNWNGEGKILPLMLYRPKDSSTPPKVGSLLLGQSRRAVNTLSAQWENLGFA